MPRLSLTPLKLKSLKPPAPGPAGRVVQVDYWDESLPGFGLRISSTGVRTWVLITRVLRGGAFRQARLAIGPYAVAEGDPAGLSLAAARKRASEWKAAAKRGEDPAAAVRGERQEKIDASRLTFQAVAEEFLERYCTKLRPGTIRQYKDLLLNTGDLAELRSKPLRSITRRHVIDVLDAIVDRGAGVRANRALATIRKMMNWAVQREYIAFAPTDHIDAPTPEAPRARHLFGDPDSILPSEIALAWQAFDRVGRYGVLLKLLLLIGQRRDEVAGMRDDEFVELDGEKPRWSLPAERTKNKRPHVVPLCPLAVELIKSVRPAPGSHFLFSGTGATPFSGFSKLKAEVDRVVSELKANGAYKGQLESQWQLHDLRRTFATGLIELGVSENIVDVLQNHVSGQARRGVRKHYNHAKHEARKREAMRVWETHVRHLIEPAQSNVIPLVVA